MFLPEDFGEAETDNLTARITTMEDVVRESERAADFCLLHGVDRKSSSLMALFVEEMAGNVVKHGKPRNRNGICVDYRLFAKENMICLSLRDFCGEFDPMKYYELTPGFSGRSMVLRWTAGSFRRQKITFWSICTGCARFSPMPFMTGCILFLPECRKTCTWSTAISR